MRNHPANLIFSLLSFDKDTLGNYLISLMDVSPYPRTGQEVGKQSYGVKLMVQELR